MPAPAASADLSYTGFVMLATLLAAMWLCYGLVLAVIRHDQRELSRQQEVQDRLLGILQPLLGPGSASNRFAPGTTCRAAPPDAPGGTACHRRLVGGARSCAVPPRCLPLCRAQPFRAFKGVRPRLTLQFEDVGLTLNDGRSILSGVTGRWGRQGGQQGQQGTARASRGTRSGRMQAHAGCHARPLPVCRFEHSRLAAILGPSGAGRPRRLPGRLNSCSSAGRLPAPRAHPHLGGPQGRRPSSAC